MGKHYCGVCERALGQQTDGADYCDVFLTHDSTSVRKAHNAGRNHLQNVRDYYASLPPGDVQSVLDTLTKEYERRDMRAPPELTAPPMAFGVPPFAAGPYGRPPAPWGPPGMVGRPPMRPPPVQPPPGVRPPLAQSPTGGMSPNLARPPSDYSRPPPNFSRPPPSTAQSPPGR